MNKKKYESLRNEYLLLKFFQPWSFLRVSPAFLKLWKCSILPPWRLNSNLYIKYRVSFKISRNEGNFEHWPFKKKVLPGVAKPCLMVLQPLVEFWFGLQAKKIAKKYGIFYKFASKLKRCSKLPSFTVLCSSSRPSLRWNSWTSIFDKRILSFALCYSVFTALSTGGF